MQDFDPSADHYANVRSRARARARMRPLAGPLKRSLARSPIAQMNRAVQESLLQTGDDGFENPTIVLFAAWPCDLDVDFKLAAPLATTVEVSYAGGRLVSLVVDPPDRASAVKWAGCVPNGEP